MTTSLGTVLGHCAGKTIRGVIETPGDIERGVLTIQFTDGSVIHVFTMQDMTEFQKKDTSVRLGGIVVHNTLHSEPVANIADDVVINEDCGTEKGNPMRDVNVWLLGEDLPELPDENEGDVDADEPFHPVDHVNFDDLG